MKLKAILAGFGIAAICAGCATPIPHGAIYTKVKMPVSSTKNIEGMKKGESECQSILGLIALGDASIEAAKKNGDISEVSHVDWEVENILGIIGKYKTVVYGK